MYFRIVVSFLILGTQACSIGYLAKQGLYQAELLFGREPVIEVLQDEGRKPFVYEKLAFILDVRAFAKQYIKLTPGSNYTTVNLTWDKVIYNISASEQLSFTPYLWDFPIIGSVPYKGYFSQEDAQKEAVQLKAEGYDVLERTAGGYSTLGYFSDPIWPSMLERPDFLLAELVIHEYAHATTYISGKTSLNENYANFVGRVGALQYFKKKYGPKSKAVQRINAYYQDQDLHKRWMQVLHAKLEKLYASNLSDANKFLKKKNIIQQARVDYRKIKFKTKYFRLPLKTLNNANIMSFRRYNDEWDKMSDLFVELNYNWKAFHKAVAKL